MRCCLCNRPMLSAAVFIGIMPVGPVCARRAGLVEKARKKHGALRIAPGSAAGPAQRKADDKTLDLFDSLEEK